MNTATTPHTPLETLLLFRAIAQHGLDERDFVRIAESLQGNKLLKNAPTYDARRLSPETLRDLFLRLLREELRVETEATPGPDGALSPTSKKRRLQSPPLLTLRDAPQHLEKIEAAHLKSHNAYIQQAVGEIRGFERDYDSLLREMAELEKVGARETESEQKPQSPNGVHAPGKHEAGPANGVGPSLGTSPRPPQIPIPHATPQHALRNLQPLLPQPAQQPAQQQEVRNGPLPSQHAAPEKASPAPRSPAPAHREVVPSPRLNQQEAPRIPVARPAATPKPPNGTPPVLQAPQGVTPFQPPPSPVPPTAVEGLQRPESAAGSRHSPALPPANAQPPAQGQLKWEPPYQPHALPRQPGSVNMQQPHPHNALPQPHHMPSPRPPQRSPPLPSPTTLQGQTSRPLPPPQVSIPPHSAGQFGQTIQSPPVRSPAELTGAPGSNRQPLLPTPAPNSVSQPQVPYHPQYQGYPVSTPGQVARVQSTQAAQASPAPVHPGARRNSGVPSAPAPQATAPKPSPGPVAPQQRPQAPNLQAPPYSQSPAPQSVPPPPVHPDAAHRYNSPYQPPRPAAVDRIHPRLPATATPTPAARFSPAPSAPQTPIMMLPMRLAAGSGTKWVSTSTPSTPKPGLEFRLGYDDVPSPAYEPTSPVLRSAAPSTQRRDGPTEPSKHKPSRPHVSQRGQAGFPARQPPPAATPPAGKQTSQAAAEPLFARVKDEATTPRPTTETGDTTADESVTGRPQPPRSTKRKREDLTPTPFQTPRASQMRDALPADFASSDAAAPKLVLWTRSFNKVCGSAMEQIVHHRSANMFAAPIREKDAPGYHKVVKQAQDLKTIRAAINHGNRAAAHAAAALEGGDPGSSSVWLPRTEELVPPKSIVNSSQLDRELAHMFSNAVMYNPDPHHGPGPAFLRDVEGEGEAGDGDAGGGAHQQDSGVLGYKVDEFGVVNDARGMFVEVEKLLSELRSAEVRRNVPPGMLGTGTSTRQASVLGGEGGRDDGEEDEGDGEGDGAVKRRRITRG